MNRAEITVYSTSWCPDCRLARAVLDAEGAAYTWIDIEREPSAVRIVLELNGGYRTVPTIVFPDGTVLVEPGRAELTAAIRRMSLGGRLDQEARAAEPPAARSPL